MATACGTRQFATFFVEGLMFGVDVIHVQEVVHTQEMTRVPLAPDVVKGLINLRGQIVMAIDMRGRLGLPPRGADRTSMNMIVRSDEGAVSLLVDDIGDVIDVDESAFDRLPDNIPPATRGLTQGVYTLQDRLLIVVDVQKTVVLGGAVVASTEAVA